LVRASTACDWFLLLGCVLLLLLPLLLLLLFCCPATELLLLLCAAAAAAELGRAGCRSCRPRSTLGLPSTWLRSTAVTSTAAGGMLMC